MTKLPFSIKTLLLLILYALFLGLLLREHAVEWYTATWNQGLLAIALVVIVILLDSRMVRARRTLSKKRFVLVSVVLVVMLLVPALIWSPWSFLHRFRTQMIRRVDIQALRDWGQMVNGQMKPGWIDGQEWPECVRVLRPDRVFVSVREKGGPLRVELDYGGGFMRGWAMIVGPPEMPIPDERGVLPMGPGCYVVDLGI